MVVVADSGYADTPGEKGHPGEVGSPERTNGDAAAAGGKGGWVEGGSEGSFEVQIAVHLAACIAVLSGG